ncbi:protein PAM71-like [Citrus sinensis]|nr:protein PAM71-like [Citrus sinensis]
MQNLAPHKPVISRTKLPLLLAVDSLPSRASLLRRIPISPSFQASNIGVGSGGHEGSNESENQKISGNSSEIQKAPSRILYPVSIALVLLGCGLVFSLIAFVKGGPTLVLAAIAKSGFTAAFSLIFVSEIGDKTFFIAALLAMQYEKVLVELVSFTLKLLVLYFIYKVLLGSMAALALMTVLSVVIGIIFHSVPSQFQTTLPIGEYAAVTLLMFFGLKSIKDAWDLPSKEVKSGDKNGRELDELAEAEELVKEKEWGDRSMLATIALGAAQSPWGVASGAIAGHLLATSFAVLGGAFLANYISEKLVEQNFILLYHDPRSFSSNFLQLTRFSARLATLVECCF